MVTDVARKRAVVDPRSIENCLPLLGVRAAHRPVDADRRRRFQAAAFVLGTGRYHLEHHLQPVVVRRPDDLRQLVGARADVLEADVAQSGSAHALVDLARVWHCPVVMRQHKHEFDHPLPPSGSNCPTPSITYAGRTDAVSRSSTRVAPLSTRTDAMPMTFAMLISVRIRSPTIAASAGGTFSRFKIVAAICSLGLPVIASARAPVQASTAASIAAQSGMPPSGVGQYGSGLVATSAAPCNRTAL